MLQGIRPVFRFNVVIVSIYLIKRGENMFKKIITAVLATLMLLIVLPTKVFAEEIVHNDSQIVEIRDIPSIDPAVEKLEVSNSEESILVEFNEITNELKIDGTTYKPTWWPGNPNPQPGTEEYLYAQMQKNRYFNPSISPETAKACAMEVSNNLVKIAIDTIIGFVASGNYSLASFLGHTGFGFFTGMAKIYYGCIAKYIR